MILLYIISFMALTAGLFAVFQISPNQLYSDIYGALLKFTEKQSNKPKPIAKRIEELTKSKEPSGITKAMNETKEILKLTGRSGSFGMVCVLSLIMFVCGAVLSLIAGNLFLLPVAAFGMAILPFWYVMFTSHNYKKMMNSDIETSLSIITTSYIRNENIVASVEENLSYLNPPISDIFSGFLVEANLISSNIRQALATMKSKLTNPIFQEWTDAVMACQDDKTLKSTLTPIISKLSDMRIVSAELDYMMYEPLKEIITMSVLLICNVPLLYFLNKEWFAVLVGTIVGKIILAICAGVLLISVGAVIKLTKPVEYKR